MPDFNKYWYSGVAELSSYQLKQARYGEIHEGKAVMIFVTEDFWQNKQVKNEGGEPESKDNSISILKLNFLKKFTTGLYDYSLMNSVFQPVDLNEFPNALKISGSVQDWCGHVYYQFNLKKNQYHVESRSYFEKEGDVDLTIPVTYLEDQIWNLIRLNPAKLPVGNINIIPSGFYARLMHKEIKGYSANTSVINNAPENGFKTYMISYPELNRDIEIVFSSTFPYIIESWSEKYTSGWGSKARVLTSSAKRIRTIQSPYWEKNSVLDANLREELFD